MGLYFHVFLRNLPRVERIPQALLGFLSDFFESRLFAWSIRAEIFELIVNQIRPDQHLSLAVEFFPLFVIIRPGAVADVAAVLSHR